LLGEQSPEVVEAAYQYGRNLGLAFQLVDDMLDYTVDQAELGKPAGADLELGLATAPLLFAWKDNAELGTLVGRKFAAEGDVSKVRVRSTLLKCLLLLDPLADNRFPGPRTRAEQRRYSTDSRPGAGLHRQGAQCHRGFSGQRG